MPKTEQEFPRTCSLMSVRTIAQLFCLGIGVLPGLLYLTQENITVAWWLPLYLAYLIAVVGLGYLVPFSRGIGLIYNLGISLLADCYIASYAITGSSPTLADIVLLLKTTGPEASALLAANKLAFAAFVFIVGVQMLGALFAYKSPLQIRFSPRKRILTLVPLTFPLLIGELSGLYPLYAIQLGFQAKVFNQANLSEPLAPVRGVTRSAVADKEVVLLVIGESSQAEYWQIYGYPRPTTPLLQKRVERGELIRFDRHMSTAHATFAAVPAILGPYGEMAEDPQRVTKQSLVSIFKQSGFKTSWLSTQNPLNATTEADTSSFVEGDDLLSSAHGYDEILFPKLQAWLTKTEGSSAFSVLHTNGSHIPFETRYPAAYRKWKNYGTAFPASQNEDNYANSILYTDYVLDGIIRLTEQGSRPTLVVYVADHGETLMKGVLRSKLSSVGSEVLHVPFLLWANKAWRDLHFEKWKALQEREAAHTVTSHLDVSPTIAGLSDITYQGAPSARDLSSSKYKSWSSTPALGVDLVTTIQVSPPAR